MLLTGFVTLALASFAVARTPSRRVAHESRRSLPSGWAPVRRADADAILPLRVGLVQSNLDNLESFLMDVAHPDSPNYGNHWTSAQVASAFRPSRESVDAVRAWLVEDGFIDANRIALSRSGGWVTVNVTIEEAEHLLGTEYYVYENAKDGRKHIACQGSYTLPEHLSKHVDLITPTLHFDVGMRRHGTYDKSKNIGSTGFGAQPKMGGPVHSIFTQLEHCDETITLACLQTLYKFIDIPLPTKKNSIGVVEYSPQSHDPADFDVFFGNYSKSQIGERPTFVSIDGGDINDFGLFAESSLDLQYVMGLVGKGQAVTLYQVGDDVEGGSFNTLLDALDGSYCTFEGGDDPTVDPPYPDPFGGGYTGPLQCGGAPLSDVISTSYGYQEAELSHAYVQRQCSEYGKLSLTGVTFVYSSGDSGVEGAFGECLDDNDQETFDGTRFNPTFPGGCPYVTSVGATQVVPGNSVLQPEHAVFQIFPSGGGFSNVFPRPAFQQAAVEGYLNKYPPPYPAGTFNATGRAFPDVAANGLNYSVAIEGTLELVSGTSASAPTFASILSAINGARLAIGKKPVGWVNPALYQFEFGFNDITVGDNPGCGTNGFAAKPGWDPVSGLGTPNFALLLPYFLALP